MGNDSDDIVSLPSPPPPRPAARQAAIETALRKFDGVEDPASPQPARGRPRRQWATLHRHPAGILVAAALIAVVSVPAIQVLMRDHSAAEVVETADTPLSPPSRVSPGPGSGPVATRVAPVAGPAPASPAAGSLAPALPVGRGPSSAGFNQARPATDTPTPVSDVSSPTMAAAAPPPPTPPPPPPPSPEAEAAAEADEIVLTGSRITRPQAESRSAAKAQRNTETASPLAMIDRYGEFLSRLQAGLRANDRRAVVRLVALPLRVTIDGQPQVYRSASDLEGDFDLIFTPAVRQAALAMQAGTLQSRDGGRLRGNGRLWFGTSCSGPTCPSDAPIRIRELNP